ncbi:MAG: hypothetical protein WBL95_27245 [Microcoleus sp.]
MPTEPYALCPMPHALCPVVPHLSEKGYIYCRSIQTLDHINSENLDTNVRFCNLRYIRCSAGQSA